MALETGRFSAKYALSIAAVLAAGGLALPAAAADLGGNCCADLEERVAELEATTVRKGNRKVSLTISGQVTTGLMYWSDGNDTEGASGSDFYVVDNTAGGGTFIAFSGAAAINPNLSAGFNITLGLCAGARSHHVTQKDDDAAQPANTCFNGAGDTTNVVTLANWYLDHKQYGRVTVGRINTATAGISTIDLGGAGVVANSQIGYWQRGMELSVNGVLQGSAATWSAALGGASVNGAGLSRANAISYTSPTFGGFQAAAAFGEDNIWDVSLRYAGEFSGFRVAAGIGYINNSSGLNEVAKDVDGQPFDGPEQWKGSASILHVASGLFLTGAYLRQESDTNTVTGGAAPSISTDSTLWYLQGGIAKNWTGLGNTVLYGEYARVDDGAVGLLARIVDEDVFNVTSSEATVWGLGVVQHIDAAAMELFLSYRRYSAEATTELGTQEFDDFDVVFGGARIRF